MHSSQNEEAINIWAELPPFFITVVHSLLWNTGVNRNRSQKPHTCPEIFASVEKMTHYIYLPTVVSKLYLNKRLEN